MRSVRLCVLGKDHREASWALLPSLLDPQERILRRGVPMPHKHHTAAEEFKPERVRSCAQPHGVAERDKGAAKVCWTSL
jgi:hypothetical protein